MKASFLFFIILALCGGLMLGAARVAPPAKFQTDYDFYAANAFKTVANTTTETSIVPTSNYGSMTIPTLAFATNRTFTVYAQGFYSTAGVLPGTLRIRVKLGSVVLSDTGADALLVGVSNSSWCLYHTFNVRSTGASGTVMPYTSMMIPGALGFPASMQEWFPPATATSTIDTTANQLIDITVQWGTASASNTMTCTTLFARRDT